jgi:hypothetical protein
MKRLILPLAALLLAAALPAAAQTVDTGPHFGARAGVTRTPDQIHLGAHAELFELAPSVMFLPSVEVGFGDHATTWAFNGELAWTLPLPGVRGWQSYAGGGLAIVYSKFDLPAAFDDSRTDIGATVLVGVSKMLKLGHKFFTEVKLGLEDTPDLKVTAGLTFF